MHAVNFDLVHDDTERGCSDSRIKQMRVFEISAKVGPGQNQGALCACDAHYV
jgi:hypothetical protein